MIIFKIILAFLSVVVVNSNKLCPNGSLERPDNCYYFQSNSSEFATAENFCYSIGGHLVSIHDAFSNALLAGEAPNYFQQSSTSNFWIGATTLMNSSKWAWMDFTPFDFMDWAINEPKNISASNCVSVSIASGSWTSEDCFKLKPFVCEIIPKPTNPPFISCPKGWIYFQSSKSCIGISQNFGHVNWTFAEEKCISWGAHLVSIHSEDEYKFCEAFDYYAWAGPFWTGGYSIDGGNTWIYTDGKPFDYDLDPFNNVKTNGCAAAGNSGLYIIECAENRLFLCKKKA